MPSAHYRDHFFKEISFCDWRPYETPVASYNSRAKLNFLLQNVGCHVRMAFMD